jgi:hypothetical protein
MSPKRWLLITIAFTLATGGAVAAFNAAYDIYGLFRETRGRKLAAYGDPRVAKFLLSSRYVPENFNGVLLGTSVSANWDVSSLGPFRVYNESINGGNITEEKAIVERALSRRGINVAFLLVQPYLTRSHDFETARLTPDLQYSAIASFSLLDAYKTMINVRLGRIHLETDWTGTQNFENYKLVLNPVLRTMLEPGEEFEVDSIAFAAYRDLVAELRTRGVQTVFVVPPIYEELLQRKRAAFDNYARRILATAPDNPSIDFTSDRFAEFRLNRANFGDGVHLLPPAANQVVAELNRFVADLVSKGELRLP